MRYDFVIVGSGVAGLSASFMLAERGYRVSLVGLPGLTSMVAGSSSGILTYHMREPFLSWAIRTAEIYESLGQMIVEKVDSVWFSTDLDFVRAVEVKLAEKGLRVRRDEEKARELLGSYRSFEGEKALVADAFRLRVKDLIDALTSRAVSAGVAILEGWGKVGDGGVYLKNERIEGEVIVAAGAWAKEVLGLPGLIVYKCQAARLGSPRLWSMVIDDVLDFYVNLFHDGTIAVGDGVNVVTATPEDALWPDKALLEEIIERARKRGIIGSYEVSRYVSAPCVGTRDTFPLVGELKEGLYVLTAFDGVGFSIAPALAEALADHLHRGTPLPPQVDPKRELEPGEPVEPVD
ncbi:MAG: FAD-binding oxidoreductase [Acidilobaceae archaeon]|nr:FAD-binding oxidoreductase [Acidilobaceae archaeon]MCX8165697.1 FAD-binding oxidoreductase [Acidilobaceae archaeon]MDW7974122.1 FAD-binding oxidoreductase [Sulfolobales archaeon]